jgi:hypothetical protein
VPKGVGKAYLQTTLNCYSRYASDRLYMIKRPLTAVHALNNDVLLFFEQHGVRIETVFSEIAGRCCGRRHHVPFEFF